MVRIISICLITMLFSFSVVAYAGQPDNDADGVPFELLQMQILQLNERISNIELRECPVPTAECPCWTAAELELDIIFEFGTIICLDEEKFMTLSHSDPTIALVGTDTPSNGSLCFVEIEGTPLDRRIGSLTEAEVLSCRDSLRNSRLWELNCGP